MPGAHDHQAVGLVEVAGDLGDELARCRCRPSRRGRRSPRATRSLRSRASALTSATEASGEVGGLQVDERLVERERLDQRADLAQQRHHRRGWCRGRRGTVRRGTRRWGTGAGPRRSTSPSAPRTCAPRRTRSPPRHGRRHRRRRPACRAGRACRAAPRPRRTRRDRRAGSSARSARRDRATRRRRTPVRPGTGSRPQAVPAAQLSTGRAAGSCRRAVPAHRVARMTQPQTLHLRGPQPHRPASPSSRWCSASIRPTPWCCSPSARAEGPGPRPSTPASTSRSTRPSRRRSPSVLLGAVSANRRAAGRACCSTPTTSRSPGRSSTLLARPAARGARSR